MRKLKTLKQRFSQRDSGLKRQWKIFLSMFALVAGLNASSQNSADILLDASSGSFTVGTNFTVNVNVHFNSGSLDAAAVFIDFDNTKLSVVSATNSSSTSILPLVGQPLDAPATMNSTGRISYQAATSSSFPTTDFTIISVTFQAIQTGTANVTFRRPPTGAPNTNLARSGLPILAAVTNGSYNLVNCTPPTASISNTGTCNGQAFNLVLSSATGTGPFDLVINGTTYNDIAVGSTITPFTPASENLYGSTPPPAAEEADAPVTLGLKFSSSVTGFVKGVRFYSQSVPSGTYTGQLWSNAGALLASATFTGVTGSAWQQVLFSTPVQIAANTTYVVSYHTNTGYQATVGNLNSAFTNGDLTAPSSGTSGGNGVYMYDADAGSAGANFPVNSFNGSNYWVDVVFVPSNYTFNLTSVTDNGGCTNVGAPLQSLNVLSIDCASLPVTLLSLSATPQGKNVLLSWSTATEIDNKGFEIQRSTANSAWEGLGFVIGAGNSTSVKNYSYTDNNLFSGRYFYRLKQVDIDGHYKYSMVVSATLDGKEDYALTQNYPNPFRGETTIQYTLPERSKVNITVFDMNGRVMRVLVNTTKEAGNHALIFYSNTLPAGMYYYQVQAGSYKASKKMIIQ